MKRSLASAIRSGAQGVQGPVRRPPRRRRDEPLESVLRGPRAAAHDPRRHRLRLRRGADRPTGRIGVKVWINKGEIMPEGYGGVPGGGKETRLGDQDTARRRGGATRGPRRLARERARTAARTARGLGPVRPRPARRPGAGGGRAAGAAPAGAARAWPAASRAARRDEERPAERREAAAGRAEGDRDRPPAVETHGRRARAAEAGDRARRDGERLTS